MKTKFLLFTIMAVLPFLLSSCQNDDEDSRKLTSSVNVKISPLTGSDLNVYFAQAGTTYSVKVETSVSIDQENSNTDAYVKSVDVYWDDQLVQTFNNPSFTFSYDLPNNSMGLHQMYFMVHLGSHGIDNLEPRKSNVITIDVINEAPTLDVQLDAPDIIENGVKFTAEAVVAENTIGTPTKVVFYLDNNPLGTVGVAPYKLTTSISGISAGVHTLYAHTYIKPHHQETAGRWIIEKAVVVK